MGTALAGPLECPVSTDVSNVRSLHSRRIVRTAPLLRTAFLEVDVDTDRAVVGAPLVGPDEGVLQSFHRARRREDVVDPPPDVPLARAAPLPPPSVMVRLVGMQGAKGVHPVLCQNSALLK